MAGKFCLLILIALLANNLKAQNRYAISLCGLKSLVTKSQLDSFLNSNCKKFRVESLATNDPGTLQVIDFSYTCIYKGPPMRMAESKRISEATLGKDLSFIMLQMQPGDALTFSNFHIREGNVIYTEKKGFTITIKY